MKAPSPDTRKANTLNIFIPLYSNFSESQLEILRVSFGRADAFLIGIEFGAPWVRT